MSEMSDYLKRRTEELKRLYSDSAEHIESELQDYLKEDGPAADDEFYFLLKRRLELDHPKPVKQKRSPIGRRDLRGTSRR